MMSYPEARARIAARLFTIRLQAALGSQPSGWAAGLSQSQITARLAQRLQEPRR